MSTDRGGMSGSSVSGTGVGRDDPPSSGGVLLTGNPS
jgi:hypothetical protein